MTDPIPTGVDRREVIWPNEKLILSTETASATSVPQVGGVTITPKVTQVVVNSVDPALTLSTRSDVVNLDGTGMMRAFLVCTDDVDIEPHNSWTYTFKGDWSGAPTVTCPVPKVDVDPGTGLMPPLNLSTAVSIASVSGVLVTKGLTGDPGPGIESIAPDGTVTLTDGSTVTWDLPPIAVADDAVSRVKLAPAVRTELDGLLTEADAATTYATPGAVATAVSPKLDQAAVDARVTAVGNATYATPAQVDARVTAVGDTAYAPVLDLYVEKFAGPDFTWGVDDTAPWQAAIDAAHAVVARVRINAKPGRVYRVNPLKVYSATTIDFRGATLQPIARVGGTNVWDALIYTAGCVAANGCTGDGSTVVSDVEIVNGIFDTQSKAYATIKAQNASAIAVRSCSFPTNEIRTAIRFDTNTSKCVADGNRITSTLDSPFGTIVNAQGIAVASDAVDATGGAYGLYGTGTVDTTTFTDPTNLSKQHQIINNWIENGTHGISLWGAESCIIEGNTIINPSHRGVIASPVSYRNVISGNTVYGTFSCAVLLAFGSRWNAVSGNMAYCTSSQSEMNGFRASYGASDNHFVGNYAYGVAGAGFRAFSGAINNSFIANKAESCGSGIELRSLNPDNGYQQNVNTPAMTGNVAQGNHFIGCGVGISLRSGTTVTTGSTPATSGAVSVPLRNCTIIGNTVQNSTSQGLLIIEDTAGSVTLLAAFANAMTGNGGTDWQTPRSSGHFTSFLSNSGVGMQAVHRLPVSGNADEWRDSADALKAFISSTGSMVTAGRRAGGSSVASTVAMDYVNTSGNGNIGLRVDGQSAQTADLQQWTVNATPSATVIPQTRIGPLGHFITALHAAPSDATLNAGDMALWFDQANGAAKLMIKAKQADGTVKTAAVALS